MKPETLQLARNLITAFEGQRLTSYQDSGGVWTIGVGHTGMVRGAKLGPGVVITQDESDALFASDTAGLISMVQALTPTKAAGLISFGFNCGAKLLQAYLDGRIKSVLPYVHDRHGNVLTGLVNRRKLEQSLIDLV